MQLRKKSFCLGTGNKYLEDFDWNGLVNGFLICSSHPTGGAAIMSRPEPRMRELASWPSSVACAVRRPGDPFDPVPGWGEGSTSSLSHSPQLACHTLLSSPSECWTLSLQHLWKTLSRNREGAGTSERWLPRASSREGLRGLGGGKRREGGGQPLVGGTLGGRLSPQHRTSALEHLCPAP